MDLTWEAMTELAKSLGGRQPTSRSHSPAIRVPSRGIASPSSSFFLLRREAFFLLPLLFPSSHVGQGGGGRRWHIWAVQCPNLNGPYSVWIWWAWASRVHGPTILPIAGGVYKNPKRKHQRSRLEAETEREKQHPNPSPPLSSRTRASALPPGAPPPPPPHPPRAMVRPASSSLLGAVCISPLIWLISVLTPLLFAGGDPRAQEVTTSSISRFGAWFAISLVGHLLAPPMRAFPPRIVAA